MRELAGFDPDRARVVARWPLRDALLAYLHLLQHRALADHQRAYTDYLLRAAVTKNPGKPPGVPSIIRRRSRGDT